MTVPRQELFDAERSRAMTRSDKHDISESVRNQLHPAKDEGPHEQFAQLAVGLHERHQVFAIELNDFTRLGGARPDKRAAAGEHVDLTGELTGSMDGDERFSGTGWLDNLNLTGRDDEERHDLLTRFDQYLTRLNLTHVTVRSDTRDLRRC